MAAGINDENNEQKSIPLGKLRKNKAVAKRNDGKKDFRTVERRNRNEIKDCQADINNDNQGKDGNEQRVRLRKNSYQNTKNKRHNNI